MSQPTPRSQDSANFSLLQKNLPRVDSYYDRVHQAAWTGRTAGLWAGAMVGSAYGALVGAGLALLPALVLGSAAPSLVAVATTASIIAGAGAMLGIAIFTDVGVTAAAVAAGFEERERREKLEMLRTRDPKLAAIAESIINPSQDTIDRPLSLQETFLRYVNPKVMGVGMLLGGLTGALFSANVSSSFVNLLPSALQNTALIPLACTATFGLMGSVFGVRMSYVSNRVANLAHSVLTGRVFDAPKTPDPVLAPLESAIEQTLTATPRRSNHPAHVLDVERVLSHQAVHTGVSL